MSSTENVIAASGHRLFPSSRRVYIKGSRPDLRVPMREIALSPTHRLLVVRSRSRGGLVSAVYWEHEEYDTTGRLIARYKTFEEISRAGTQQRGWCKYDGNGHLVAEADSLSRATVTLSN